MKVSYEKVFKSWRDFGWRGFSVVNFCPGCMRPLLTESTALALGGAFALANIESCKSLLHGKAAGFAFFVPSNEEIALLLEHRIIVYPFCSECGIHHAEPEYMNRVEQNIVLSRRFISKIRVPP